MILVTIKTPSYSYKWEFNSFNEFHLFASTRVKNLKTAERSPSHDFSQFNLFSTDLPLVTVWQHLLDNVSKGMPQYNAVVDNYYPKAFKFLDKGIHGMGSYVTFEVVKG
jgi:hypothetical protein